MISPPISVNYRRGLCARISLLLVVLAMGAAAPALGQLVDTGIDPKTAQEIQYANILKSWGMPDLAMIVLGRIKDPAAQMKIKVIELESMIYMGKWDEVKAKISAIPDQGGQEAWAMKLALADGYYAWGKYAEAQKIYDEFLSKYPGGPPAAIKEFFLNSAYKYAQMLILMGDKGAAIKAYDKVLVAKPPRAIERQIKAEQAELIVTQIEDGVAGASAMRPKLDKIISDLFWIQDLWFAKAVVLRAHTQIMDGEIDKAMQIITDYNQQLREMDRILKEEEEKTGQPMSKLSPMAECRYLLATVLEKEADKLIKAGGQDTKVKELLVGKQIRRGKQVVRTDGALQHYLNVFLQYPNTPWAPDAGSKAKEMQEMLERDFGASISVDVGPEQWAKVEKAQFQEARSLFNQNQYEHAVAAYLKVLNLFPESETGVAALGELARSYVELKDDLMFDVTAHYLAERFGRHRNFFIKAGDITLQLAAYMKQLGAPDKYDALMDIYFKKCPRHPSVPVMIMKRGDDKFTKEDYEGAAQDYQLVEENYSDSIVYENALNKRAICLFELDKQVEGIKALTKYIQLLEDKEIPDTELLSAKFRLAQMYRKLDKKYIPTAFKYYSEIIKLMDDKEHRFHDSLNKVEANKNIYQACLFYQGMCYVMLDKPEKNIKAYRLQAIKFFDAMVTKYPKSDFAPQCLLQIGTLYAVLGDADQAGKYLKQLQKDYPDSEEAANSDYLYADALMKMGRVKQAGEVFDRMLGGDGKYSDKQIFVAAAALLEQKRYEIALKAFEKLKNTKEESMKQRVMLGLGESYYGTGQPKKAIEVLEDMLSKYDKTGHTPTAATFLSKAYGDIAMEEGDPKERKLLFNQAVKHEKTVRKYQKTEEAKKRSDLRVGLILKKKALAEEKFGDEEAAKEYKGKAAASLQTIIMFTDAKIPAMGNVLQDAYMESLPLLAELEMWREVMEAADQYMRDFPAPQGKYTSEMRSLRNKAKVRAATMGDVEDEEENLAEDVELILDEDEKPEGEEGQPAEGAPVEAPAEAPAGDPAVEAPAEEPAPATTD